MVEKDSNWSQKNRKYFFFVDKLLLHYMAASSGLREMFTQVISIQMFIFIILLIIVNEWHRC